MNISPSHHRAEAACLCRAGASDGQIGCLQGLARGHGHRRLSALRCCHPRLHCPSIRERGRTGWAVAFEQLVLLYLDKDVQIASWAAAHASFAFASKANARASFNASRDVHRKRAFFFDAACATAGLQGFLMIWPRPEHVGQVRSTVKKPCCARTLPMPEQVGQVEVLRRLQRRYRCRIHSYGRWHVDGFCRPEKASSSVTRRL